MIRDDDGTENLMTGRWTDVFRSDATVHLAIMASITAATFQGYLKDRFAGPIPYALADLFFIGAAAVWFGFLAIRHAPLRGPGAVPGLLLIVTIAPAAYLLHPGSPPIIALAGLRGWSEFPVAAIIALTLIRSEGQVRAYVGLILLLCVITAIYGVLQYQSGPDVLLSVGDLAIQRHGTSTGYYLASEGVTEFRAFSTFTYPAPFAGMMVFGMLLAAGIAVSESRPIRMRIGCALLIPLLFAGMTVSGTRAALIILLGGLMVVGFYRGFTIRQVLLVPVGLLALHIGTLLTAGRIIERYRSVIQDEQTLWIYLYAPITIAGRALRDSPLGAGLGRTGVGVPFSIIQSMPSDFFVFSDGDIGRAAVELGVLGLIILALILFGLLPYVARAMRVLLGTQSEDIALGAGPLVIATGALLLIGSPLATAPHGIIWWFLFGAVVKLGMLQVESDSIAEEEDAAEEELAASDPGRDS